MCISYTISRRISRCFNTSPTDGDNYCKHLTLYHDQRFSKHPCFRYFTLNTVMRHRALQTGRIYVHQNPNDGHLTIDELRDMVGHDRDTLSNRVLHF